MQHSSIDGQLNITLFLDEAKVHRVAISNHRPLAMTHMFIGMEPTHVLSRLPLLYSVCGKAQSVAAVTTFESALGLQPKPLATQLRSRLVALETFNEHLLKLLLKWPQLVDEPPHASMARAIQQVLLPIQQRLLSTHCLHLGGGNKPIAKRIWESQITALTAVVGDRVFGCPVKHWLSIETLEDLIQWLHHCDRPAATQLKTIIAKHWQTLGDSPRFHLPPLQPDHLSQSLQEPGFQRYPRWHDQCGWTGASSRTDSPLLQEVRALYGDGLLTVELSKLTEMAQLLQFLATDKPCVNIAPQYLAEQSALLQLESARGRLVHQITLENSRVKHYRILAPTEWNCHPEGHLAIGLACLSGTESLIRQQAELLIYGADPCVGHTLTLTELNQNA